MTGRSGYLAGVFLWAALVFMEAGAQICLKLGGGAVLDIAVGPSWFEAALLSPWVWLGGACYIGSFFVWMLILRTTQLSLAFPSSAAIYIVIVPASWALLGESMDLGRLGGTLLVAAGVAVMGLEWRRTG